MILRSLFARSQPAFLIVGLGNPGPAYDLTRHNIGFSVADRLLSENQSIKKKKVSYIKGSLASFKIHNKTILVLKPDTFMNLSGQAVAAAVNYYKIDLNHIIVMCDDLDLPLGTIRFRKDGSSGGHNGLKSVEASLNSQCFGRLKIGIGNEKLKQIKESSHVSRVADFVLEKFQPSEMDIVSRSIDLAKDWCLNAIKTLKFETVTLKV